MQIIVIYILLIILFAIFKKVNAYDAFLAAKRHKLTAQPCPKQAAAYIS